MKIPLKIVRLDKIKNEIIRATVHMRALRDKRESRLKCFGYVQRRQEDLNPILLKLFRAIDSSTAGLQKPTKSTIYNSITTKAIFMKFKQSKDCLFNFC